MSINSFFDSYSRTCIIRHTSQKMSCPQCEFILDPSNPNSLIPNHTAAALIENARRTRQSINSFKKLASEINQELNQDQSLIEKMISPLDTSDSIDKATLTLKRRRMELALSEEKKKSVLLNEFIDRMIVKRNEKIAQCIREIQTLNEDKKLVNVGLKCFYSNRF